MISEALLVKTAKPLIDSLIEKIIVPKISDFEKKVKLKYDEIMIPRREHFEEYLYRSYKKYSVISTLVFKNEPRLLTELYLPLSLKKKESQEKELQIIKIEKYPVDLMNRYKKIIITDTAGMGKSTMTKRLFLDVIENGHGIPIYIELRKLKRDWTLLNEIQEQTNSLSKDFNTDLLLDFIQTGGFIFFFDGYDEIALEERSSVTTDVQDFINKANNNVFILTSRHEQALSCFGDFQEFSINPLSKKEAYELLRKYDKQGVTSKRLIEELKTGQYNIIDEFLKNPLLVSLLFAAFDYKQKIPLKKHIFYRQVYDAYFDSHDLSKGNSYIHDKHSGLDIDNFERILRHVGFMCLKKQKNEYEKDEILRIIEDAKSYCPDLEFGASDFLSDIISSVPILCIDGISYRWVHKSLMEYFAALFVFKDAKKSQDFILRAMYNSENIYGYINVLDIYYDIDTLGFIKNIEHPLLSEYKKYYDENSFTSPILTKQLIEERLSLLFAQTICIDSMAENDYWRDVFDKIKKQAKEKFGIRLSSSTITSDGIVIGVSRQPHREILSIMGKRKKDLFEIVPIKKTVTNAIHYPELQLIDLHLEEDNQKKYSLLNNCLKINILNAGLIISYRKCCEEIDKINAIIKRNEESQNLLSGI